jgi:phosphoribosylformylglycinamidine cyclo-ligase
VLSKYYAEKYTESYDQNIDAAIVYSGSKRVTDPLAGTPLSIGQALLSPTRTFAPVVRRILQELPHQVKGMVNNTGGAFTKVLHYIDELRIVKDNILLVPPIFELIQAESGTEWREMYKVLNCGTRLELYVEESNAQAVIDIARSFNIDAQIIGHVEPASKAEVIVKTDKGTFNYQ